MSAKNLLMITVDDLRAVDDWGNFAPLVQTPNLDRLAAMGTSFERAVTQVPICNASRASVFTGKQPSETGVLDNGVPWYERVDIADTLPAVLRSAGVYVAMHGKTFHPDPIDASREAVLFDEFSYSPLDGDAARVARDGVHHTTPFKSGRYTGPASDLQDERTVAAAVDFLDNRAGAGGDPFFLAVGISRPHLNWWVPPEYYALYDPAEIRAALEKSLKDGTILPGAEEFLDVPPMSRASSIHATIAEDPDLWADYIHAYLASVSYADAKIGQVLDALAADPARAAETAILLWSDNGFHFGDHDRWQKFTHWRAAAEVPMILVDPATPGGQVARQVVSLVDIFPTVLDVMGIAAPERLAPAGESLLPILEDVNRSWFDEDSGRGVALVTVMGGVSIRAVVPGYGDVRYTRYPDGTEELYRLDDDPDEHVNRLDYRTGRGLEAEDDALHGVVRALMDRRLADEGILLSDGSRPVIGSDANELLVSTSGPGSNDLRGGGGNDTYVIYKAATIVETADGGFDAVIIQNTRLEKTYVLPSHVELVQVERFFTGNEGDNHIYAGGAAGELNGLGGNDTIRAGNGGFIVDGGTGDDGLTGAIGRDTLIGGDGNDRLAGEGNNDDLSGGKGKDIIAGDPGNDTIRGGIGADVLTGGDGRDDFVFAAGNSVGGSADRITDFSGAGVAVGDRIDLSAVDADTTVAGDQAFTWRGSGTGQLRAVEEGANTVIYGNTDRNAAYEFRLVIEDGPVRAWNYTAADFVL